MTNHPSLDHIGSWPLIAAISAITFAKSNRLMTADDELIHLLEIIKALELHKPVPIEASAWLADAFDRWLAGETATLDEAMKLRSPSGSRGPATRLKLAVRDAALRDALDFYSHLSRAAAAQRVATLLARYASTGWNRDRNARTCPYGADSIKATFWRAMKAGNGRIIGAETIRKIGQGW